MRCLVLGGASVGLLACGGSEETSDPVELTGGAACADAFFWATNDAGDVAVTVRIDATDRPSDEVTTVAFEVPDDDVAVTVLEGEDLSRNFCTDVLDEASEPTGRQEATGGRGTISLDPVPDGPDPFGCGSVSGRLELTDLETEDGTTFAPIEVTSDTIGCYAG